MGKFKLLYSTVFFAFQVILISHSTVTLAQEKDTALLLETANYDIQPVAFAPIYVGVLINENHPWSFGQRTWSKGGTSFGLEYRYFYKDTWTLAVSGEFKQLSDLDGHDKSLFIGSQESMRLIRLYHPLYLGIGGKLSYISPVVKVSVPYDRDDTRTIDIGMSMTMSAIWITNPRVTTMLTVSRWRSASTTKRQGIEIAASLLHSTSDFSR